MRIGIDLGGTNIAGGLVDEEGKILKKLSVPTVLTDGDIGIMSDIASLAARLIEESPGVTISSIGIGVPGQVDRDSMEVIYCNNIPFENTDLKGYLERELSIPVYVDNDANAAALGEVLAGCAKRYRDAVMITLGTGVGFGIILENKIYSGYNGAAGELGHDVIVVDGLQCSCGRRGCLELYASATALKRYTKEAMEHNPDSLMWKLCEGNIDNISGKTAFDAQRAGDAAGIKVIETYIKYLSVGLVNVVNIFQPEAVIIGGGLSKEGENLLTPLRKILERDRYSGGDRQAVLISAELGNDAGIIGAAMLGR